MRIVVVAHTLDHARQIAAGLAQPTQHVASPRSIRNGWGRGLVGQWVAVVDDSVIPLDTDIREILNTLCAGQVYKRVNVA
jgi:hypothetical protein